MTKTARMKMLAISGVSFLALGVGGVLAQSANFAADDLGMHDVNALDYGLAVVVDQYETGNVTADVLGGTNIVIDGTIPVDGVQDVSQNSVTAMAHGNRALTLIEDGGFLNLESFGGVGAVDGDANGIGVASSQINFGDVTADVSSLTVGGRVDTGFDSNATPFEGIFTVGENSVLASATGNDGVTDVAFDGISVQGSLAGGAAPGSQLSIATGAFSATGELDGLLGTLSLQSNVGAGIDATLSGITAGVFFLDSSPLAGGTLVVRENSLAAAATGNTTDHAITVEAAGDFDASAAIASQQVNYGSTVDATASAVQVGSVVGWISGGATAVTSDNTVDATALGNVAAISASVDATNLQAGSGLAGADADFVAGQLTTSGGVTAANVQANVETPVSSTVFGVGMGVTAVAGTGDVAIGDSAVVVTDNGIRSAAVGNAATTGVTLSGSTGGGDNGTEGTLSAAVGNAQYSGSTVSAMVTGSDIGIFSILAGVGSSPGGSVEDSALTISSNQVIASATANRANNTLTAEGFATVTAGSESGIGGIGTATAIDESGANGVLALSNGQQYEGSVSAFNIGSEMGIGGFTGLGGADGSVLAMTGNAIGASATGNAAVGSGGAFGNVISIDVQTLETASGIGDNVAALSSIQGSGASVTALTVGARIGTWNYETAVENSTISVSRNVLFASAEGNIANNLITATGASYIGGNDALSGAAISTGTGLVDREYSLRNVQHETGGLFGRVVSASVTDYSIDVDVDSVTNSVATVSDNVVQALARDNSATNVIQLGSAASPFATLETSAAVVNEQQTSAMVNATIGGGGSAFVSILSETLADGSTFVIEGNQLDARAEGNRALNVVMASATELGGGGFGTGTSAGETGGVAYASADYTVLNRQVSSGPINATITGADVSLSMGGTASMSDSLATVSNNSLNAGGFANVASNQVDMASASGVSGTAAISTSQFNSGDVVASVEGTFMGVSAGTSASNTTNVVSGNAFSATAAGNTAVNKISRSSY